MTIHRAKESDINTIDTIIGEGREYLRIRGLPQWQNGYGPNRSMVERDIQLGEGYVLTAPEGAVIGYAALVRGIDDSYTHITEGQWDETYPAYISIHRVAITASWRGKGLSVKLLQDLTHIACRLGCRDVRIDTHPGNEIMERAILRAGFVYRGMVELPFPNGERRAYQFIGVSF